MLPPKCSLPPLRTKIVIPPPHPKQQFWGNAFPPNRKGRKTLWIINIIEEVLVTPLGKGVSNMTLPAKGMVWNWCSKTSHFAKQCKTKFVNSNLSQKYQGNSQPILNNVTHLSSIRDNFDNQFWYAALEHKEAVVSNYLLAVNCLQNEEEDGEMSESFTT